MSGFLTPTWRGSLRPRPARQDDVSPRPMKQRRRLKFSSLSDANDLLRHSVSHDDAVRPTSAETTVNKEMKADDEQEKQRNRKMRIKSHLWLGSASSSRPCRGITKNCSPPLQDKLQYENDVLPPMQKHYRRSVRNHSIKVRHLKLSLILSRIGSSPAKP